MRRRADVLRVHVVSCRAKADSHDDEKGLHEDGNRNVGTQLALFDSALNERDERGREGGLGRAPLAEEDDEVQADGNQGPGRTGKRFVNGNTLQVGFREEAPSLLVRGHFERAKQGVSSREVPVERSPRDAGCGCDLSHAGRLATRKDTRGRGEDPLPCRLSLNSRGHLGMNADVFLRDTVD
jgi:hypothetical protein